MRMLKTENNRLQTEKEAAMRVSKNSLTVNFTLSFFKLLAGLLAHSGAMISDAIHSASDVFSTLIVMAGINMANKEADKGHPYGHERLECVAALILALVLALTGVGVGYQGITVILSGEFEKLQTPGILALAAAIVSIVVKEWMYWYTIRVANRINSAALKADAWHHRSDALSSVGALIGIAGARLGYLLLDPLVSVLICLLILKAAVDIFKDALDKMVDKACDDAVEERLRAVIMEQKGVFGVSLLQTRMFGSKIYVDVEIEADGNLSLYESHDIAEQVHEAIELANDQVKHCMVHVNPKSNVP